eukprot:gene515-1164_t
MSSTMNGAPANTETDLFCLNDYDCIGFDMDHTVVQYHLPELFKLIYRSFAKYLVEKKGYDQQLLDEDFLKYEDYSLRGLIFEVSKGNFLKLDENGFILRACHGMRPMSDEEIIKEYGKERIWQSFSVLKKQVHHGFAYKCFENFFDMPIGVLCARIVDIKDQNKEKISVYDFWSDMIEALSNSFGPMCFTEHTGYFFSTISENADKYIKKCPREVVKWLKSLKEAGKITFLLTQSHAAYTKFLMEYSIGNDWMDLFDFVLTDAKKPDFFKIGTNLRPFLALDGEIYSRPVEQLERKTCYAHGNAGILEGTAKRILGKDSIKVVYFGDSPKSDVFPPRNYANWDSVAVLEEMEAEEVHFRKHSSCNTNGNTERKSHMVHHLLKEEKIIVASKQWGSFFRHDKEGETNCDEEKVNTFWGGIIRDNCRIAIPLLDYLTDLPIDYKFESFSPKQLGFYPGPPSTVVHYH